MVKTLKNNKLLIITFMIYVLLAVFAPGKAWASLENSAYYIKEMLMIMPLVFILITLIETWIPREWIIKNMGEDSGIKGVLLAFVMGSFSAGPIYAAFPICGILLKKGASIFNISIIISAWAVIKVPMLANEAKFLGVDFMLIRWILTAVSIVLMSYIMSKIVKKDDLKKSEALNVAGMLIDDKRCVNCEKCLREYEEFFYRKDGTIMVIDDYELIKEKTEEVLSVCPVKAIKTV